MIDVTCKKCGRHFEVAEETAREVASALCVCGEVLSLRPKEAGGSTLGNYVLTKRIGIGGMGEVFLAKLAGVEGFERQVAIKRMLPHLSNDRSFIDMMVREAKLTVTLNHPNIVQVYDLAKDGDTYYIAMEYMPAVDLGRVLDAVAEARMRLPVNVVLCIIGQLLRGLGYAHDFTTPDGQKQPILHRDITPQNILVAKDARVKITDFGIAKAMNEVSTTSPGTLKGKLGYFAPEQLRGKPPDLRIDLFCAAIVCWESFANRRLFKGEDEMDSYRRVLDVEAPSLRTIRDDISPELDRVVQRGLHKDPDKRYQTVHEFYTELMRANFDQSSDDLALATREFFQAHPEVFEHGGSEADTNITETPTLALDGKPNKKKLANITTLVSRRKKRWPYAVFIGAALMVAAAGAAYFRFEIMPKRNPASMAFLTPPKPPPSEPPPVLPPSKPEPLKQDGLREPTKKEQEREAPRKMTSAPRDAKPMEAREIQASLRSLQGPVERCLRRLDVSKAPPKLVAKVSVLAQGKVERVVLEPDLADASVNRCLVSTIKGVRFRASAQDFEFAMPLVLERVGSR